MHSGGAPLSGPPPATLYDPFEINLQLKEYREAIGDPRGPIVDLYEIGGDRDWTANELQRNQTERGHPTVGSLISFVHFVPFVVRCTTPHVIFQAVQD